MATRLAWADFGSFVGKLNRIKSDVSAIARDIENLAELKTEILDDSDRKAELKKIIDVHPDYSIVSLGSDYPKLITLKNYLEDNGYIEEG